MSQVLWDRAEVYVDGNQYLPDGQILSLRVTGGYNTKPQQSMTPDGNAIGIVVGNTNYTFEWREVMPDQTELINWRTFLLANPNSVFTVVPFALVTDEIPAPSFTITGAQCVSQTQAAPGEGQIWERSCSFTAILISNL